MLESQYNHEEEIMKVNFWFDADKIDKVFGKLGFKFLKLIGHVDAHWFNVEGVEKRFYKFHF